MDGHSSVGESDHPNKATSGRVSLRTKFQPIRVKALLHFCESDDDDNEDKDRYSESESDCDDTKLLSPNGNDSLPDDFTEKVEGSPLEAIGKKKVSNSAENIASGKCLKQQGSDVHEAGFKGAADDFKPNVQNENESVKNDLSSNDSKNIWETDYRSTNSLTSQEINTMEKCNSILRSTSNFSHSNEYDTKPNKNANIELGNNIQVTHDNMQPNEKNVIQLKNQQQKYESASTENKESQDNIKYKHSDTLPIHDDWPLKSKAENDNQSEFRRSTSTNSDSITYSSQTNTGMLQSTSINTHSLNAMQSSIEVLSNREDKNLYHANPHYSEKLIDTAIPASANLIAAATPMKHGAETGALRPNPCLSQRNIFQTPQSKLQNEFSRNQGQTPATSLSQWTHSAKKQTPLQSKSQIVRDYAQTPSSSVYGLNPVRHVTPRYAAAETKAIRQPLTDSKSMAPYSSNNDASAFPSNSKSRMVQGPHLSNVEEERQETWVNSSVNRNINIPEHRGNAPVTCLEKRFSQAQSTFHSGELKENHHPNITDVSAQNEKLVFKNVADNSKPSMSSGTRTGTKNELPQRYETEAVAVSQTKYSEPQNQFAFINENKKVHQGSGQLSNAIPSVQFSMPTNVPKPRQNKTIVVKGREYLILGVLGQGMSGEVLRVQDLSDSGLRAIKCVNLSRMDKDSAQGCLEEISMLRKLQAPCVIRMFDYEIKYPMVYVVMEMGDTDLSRLLKSMSQEKNLPLTMILYYWTEMLTAVKHIHDNGVIHSDLKPANFLLVRGRLKLIDFGIASSMNADMTSVVKNCPIGTLNYISPEALMDIGNGSDSPDHKVKYKISFKSDVWSLGCILYSLVYGRTPFHHIRSQWAKVNAITNPKPNISFPVNSGDSEKNVNPPPPILIDVMRKCLQHDPKARPTVAQLLQVEYVPLKSVTASTTVPTNLIVKLKHALKEDEWRQLVQILESRRHAW